MRISPVLIYVLIVAGSSIFKLYKKAMEKKDIANDGPVVFDQPSVSETDLNPLEVMMEEKHYSSYDADLFENMDHQEESLHDKVSILEERLQEQLSERPGQSELSSQSAKVTFRSEKNNHAKRRMKRSEDQDSLLKPELNPKNLMQGVIMAEILQPPRAKRPYRPIYMEREK